MTINEFVSVLDPKFNLSLWPLDDSAKKVMKDFLVKHENEFGLESTAKYIDRHDVSISFDVRNFKNDLQETFGKYRVVKTSNDLYDRDTLIVYYK